MGRQATLSFEDYKLAAEKFAADDLHSLSPLELAALKEIINRDVARREKIYQRRLANLDSLKDSSSTDSVDIDSHLNNEEVSTDSGSTKQGSNSEQNKEPEPRNGQKGSPNRKVKNADVVHKHSLDAKIDRSCPRCGTGRLHQTKDRVHIRIVAPLTFTRERHECEALSCRHCGYSKSADPGFDESTQVCEFSPRACSSLITQHYYMGIAFQRLETFLKFQHRNYKTSSLWDVCSLAYDRLKPLEEVLWRYVLRYAKSFRIDDSGARILALNQKIKVDENPKKRTGVNTTGIFFDIPGASPVSIFITGLHHAGEISEQMKRKRELEEKLIRLCDAASKNFINNDGYFIDACCNEHAFAHFRKIKDNHPESYAYVAEIYDEVFENERYCKENNLIGKQRLEYHQKFSRPCMSRLKVWLKEKIKSEDFDDNSDEAKAVHYISNQFDKLTEFLRTEDVPLDSNRVEQMLRVAKRYFKNSSFYKTETGAEVGDLMMSLIRTCVDADQSPIDYIEWCLENHEDLAKNPSQYLPSKFAELQKSSVMLSA